MKFYFGHIGNIKIDSNDIIKKYEAYYQRTFRGQVKNINKNNVSYVAISDKKIEDYFDDELVVVGEIHLSNYEQLCTKIGDKKITEAKLIAILYRRFGIDFIKKLVGKFSMIIKEKEKIYLIRDHLGNAQLFFYKKNNNIFFSNTLFLLEDLYSPYKIRKIFLYKFYSNVGLDDYVETPYLDVYRVLAASYMELDMIKFQCREQRYWELKSDTNTILNKIEIINEFRERLEKCVLECVRNKSDVALALSGGLDSSVLYSILCKNKNDFVAYNASFEKVQSCDERYYIEKLKGKYKVNNVKYVISDESGVLIGYPEEYYYTSEPNMDMLNKKFAERIYNEASKENKKYMMDGYGADHILSGSILFTIDWLKKGKYLKFIKQIERYAAKTNSNIWNVLLGEIRSAKKNKEYIPNIDNRMCSYYKSELKRIKRYTNKEMVVQVKALLSKKFHDYELAPRYGMDVIHPFLNHKLIEFLYSLPGDFLMEFGESKYIMKKAYEEDIPKEIISRIVKTEHVELVQKGLREYWSEIFNTLKNGRISSLKFLNRTKEEWIDEILRLRSGQYFEDDILVLVEMEIWLAEVEKKYGKLEYID